MPVPSRRRTHPLVPRALASSGDWPPCSPWIRSRAAWSSTPCSRFGYSSALQESLSATAAFFFWAGLLTAFSQLAAPHLAKRVGLLNTMVFTHIPASLCLIAAAFSNSRDVALGLLLLRALLSQMDVPARGAFVMAVVAPGERAAAASFTAVPRSLASAISPALGGALFAAGWLAAPLVACGLLKIAYDVMLWRTFRGIKSR